jgi:heterodisulfide reductase subunit A
LLRNIIEENRLNRIVIASCTPRTHEPLFKETLRKCGLNPALLEMANIRDQCSWVHQDNPAAATEKAFDLIRMATAKVYNSMPVYRHRTNMTQSALVIGGGIAGMTAALRIADQGYRTYLVEKSEGLGGNALRIPYMGIDRDVNSFISETIHRVKTHKNIKVHTNCELGSVEGSLGNFSTTLSLNGNGDTSVINHGITIIATGAREYRPREYQYGSSDRVVTALELKEKIISGTMPDKGGTVVMIQCVGSRSAENPYCSRICCTQAIENAIRLRQMDPDGQVFILYRDIRTFGLNEISYMEARKLGVKFIRFEQERNPHVEANGDSVTVTLFDPVLGKMVGIDADIVVLSTGIHPDPGNGNLSKLFKVPLNRDGFFLEAHMKLRPVDFASDGVFVCGLAHGPKSISDSIIQAEAAAARALRFLSRNTIEVEATTVSVDEHRCQGCGTCESICPYGAIVLDNQKNVAVVTASICKGCGSCAAGCRSGALNLPGNADEDIFAMLNTLTGIHHDR